MKVKEINSSKIYRNVPFLEPGLVSYENEDKGIWLYRKEVIDSLVQSLEGKSITINHIPDEDNDGTKTDAYGVVTSIRMMDDSGKYCCDIAVWDKSAQDLCDKGFGVSVGLGDLTYDDKGGKWHGIDYDAELVNAVCTHLALTDKPRLEEMRVLVNSKEARLYNSKEGIEMFKLFKKKLENSAEESQIITFNGKTYNVAEMVKVFEAEQAEKAAMTAQESGQDIGADGTVKQGDKDYKVMDLIKAADAAEQKKADDKKAADDKDAEDKKKEKLDNASDDEKAAAAAKEKKDADDKAADDKKKAEKLDNANKDDKEKSTFQMLNNAFENAEEVKDFAPNTVTERIKRGKDYFKKARENAGK
jgi:hypothetical protein